MGGEREGAGKGLKYQGRKRRKKEGGRGRFGTCKLDIGQTIKREKVKGGS